jgi:predicted RNA-binding Zn-ribbon protein involved in translation (DUF1610 family)
MPWQQLKTAARRRQISVSTITGLEEYEKVEVKRAAALAILDWYAQHDTDSAEAPELLCTTQALLEATAAAGIPSTQDPTNDQLNELRKWLAVSHIEQIIAESESSDSDSDSDEEDSDQEESDEEDIGARIYCADEGITLFASTAQWMKGEVTVGTRRTVYPSRTPGKAAQERGKVNERVANLMGATLVFHSNAGEKWTQYRCTLTDLSAASHEYHQSFHVLCRTTGRQFYFAPAALDVIPSVDSWEEAFDTAVQEGLDVELIEEELMPAAGFFLVPSLDVDLDANDAADLLLADTLFEQVVSREQAAPPSVDISRFGSARKKKSRKPKSPTKGAPWMRAGGSKDHPMHTQVADAKEQEIVNHANALRETLADGLCHIVSGLERLQEAYEPPSNTNLVTGEKLDARLTESEKLSALARSYAAPAALKQVNSCCVVCSSKKIEQLRTHSMDFDSSNPKQDLVQDALVYGDSPTQRSCPDCPGNNGYPQPMHPNPFVPTVCFACQRMVFLEGKIKFACPHCSHSWVTPSNVSKDLTAAAENSGKLSEKEWK